jgi:hypothetical protein
MVKGAILGDVTGMTDDTKNVGKQGRPHTDDQKTNYRIIVFIIQNNQPCL